MQRSRPELAYHDDVISLGESALENRENVVRLLNAYISSLINLRDEIDASDREAVTGAAGRCAAGTHPLARMNASRRNG